MTKDINYSIEEISRTAKIILSLNPSSKIFIFNGEMGSGKTTLIKAIIKELGYEGTVSSPTFSIINEYLNGDKIYHFDFYRIKNKNELLDIGIDEYISRCCKTNIRDSLRSTLKTLGIFLVLFLICYFVLARGEETPLRDSKMLSAVGSRLISAALFMFYSLILIASGSMLWFGMKNRK